MGQGVRRGIAEALFGFASASGWRSPWGSHVCIYYLDDLADGSREGLE